MGKRRSVWSPAYQAPCRPSKGGEEHWVGRLRGFCIFLSPVFVLPVRPHKTPFPCSARIRLSTVHPAGDTGATPVLRADRRPPYPRQSRVPDADTVGHGAGRLGCFFAGVLPADVVGSEVRNGEMADRKVERDWRLKIGDWKLRGGNRNMGGRKMTRSPGSSFSYLSVRHLPVVRPTQAGRLRYGCG